MAASVAGGGAARLVANVAAVVVGGGGGVGGFVVVVPRSSSSGDEGHGTSGSRHASGEEGTWKGVPLPQGPYFAEGRIAKSFVPHGRPSSSLPTTSKWISAKFRPRPVWVGVGRV